MHMSQGPDQKDQKTTATVLVALNPKPWTP